MYTGRGPVCGTIMRGAGGCGGAAGADGRDGAIVELGGAAGEALAVGAGAETVVAGGGGGTGGTAGRATGGTTAAGVLTAGFSIGAGGAGRATGATGAGGCTATGAAAAGGGACGVIAGFGGVTGGAGVTAGRVVTGAGGAGFGGAGGGAAAASFRCVMALRTSPGREMCDRSILVLISSSPRAERDDFWAEECPSALVRKWARTLSASKSSRELECVFFSVTPTSGKTSRMALLLTSSSLAKSLMRTLLIRPFFRPALCLCLHRSLMESECMLHAA